MLVACAILVSVLAGRLLQVQAFDVDGDALAAAQKLQDTRVLPAERGEITDALGNPLVTTETAFAITADPTLTNPMETDEESGVSYPAENNQVIAIAAIMAEHLGGSMEDYLPALTKQDTRFAYVAKKVPAATYAAIVDDLNEIGANGIFREVDSIRSYPNGSLAANILGFVGYEGDGLAGLEYQLNKQLKGTPGRELYDRAPDGNRIPLGAHGKTPAVDGVDYQLTIDSDVQFMAEQALSKQISKVQAESGIAIVMDVKTGQVVAMATAPGYDPSVPGKGDPADMGNRAVQMSYEPGSVQKVLTLAAVMDAGLADRDTRVIVPGSVQVGDAPVKDVWSHGTIHLTTRGIIAKSSNIGTILLARQMSTDKFHGKLADFGLGAPTGIELPGESAGMLPGPDMASWKRDQISFGQGLSVTAIQEAAAIAGILNGGIYNPPTILKGATDADGNPIDLPRREPRRVVSERTSSVMAEMMEGILYNDSNRQHLGLENYRTGGKTGTAERYDSECGCYRGRTTSYAGYAPAEDPRLLTYVVLDDVVKGNSGGATAGPVYRDIMNYALPHVGVTPSTTKPRLGGLDW